MSNKPPPHVAKNIKDLVYQAADSFNYLGKSRTENGQFLDALVARPDIGDVLAGYVRKAEIRTYIKDAILNRYSKDKTRASRPTCFIEIISKKFGFASVKIDSGNSVCLYKSQQTNSSQYVVVAEGTFLKWETALRKALLYIPEKPFSKNQSNKIFILLNVFAQHKPISSAEKLFLDKALAQCNAKVHVYGEG